MAHARASSPEVARCRRYVSTGHPIAPYAKTVPDIVWRHTLCQCRTSHSTIRYASTAHCIAPSAVSVLDIV
eukprot:2731240-Rhodomonas_salina.4